MTKAEEAALKAWPEQIVRTNFDTQEFDEKPLIKAVYNMVVWLLENKYI